VSILLLACLGTALHFTRQS